jgi:hypothetical protein
MRTITKDMRDTLKREAIVVRPDGTWTTLAQHMKAIVEMDVRSYPQERLLAARVLAGPEADSMRQAIDQAVHYGGTTRAYTLARLKRD